MVPASHRADDDRKATTVGQGRSHDLREQRWWYVGIFIQHDPVETEPAQSVPVIAAVEADPAAAEQVDAQLRLVGRTRQDWPGESFEHIPSYGFCPIVESNRSINVAKVLPQRR
jgi:hypothetical protein